MTFGEVIAQERKKKGISQKELAARILKEDGKPISPQYLNDIEQRRRNPPGVHLLNQFAEVLEIPEEYLYFLARKYPADLRDMPSNPENVKAAFSAFRRALGDKTK